MSNIHWNNVMIFSKNEGMTWQCQSRPGGMTAVSSHFSATGSAESLSDTPLGEFTTERLKKVWTKLTEFSEL